MKTLLQFLGACLIFAVLGGVGYYGLELLSGRDDGLAGSDSDGRAVDESRTTLDEFPERDLGNGAGTHGAEGPVVGDPDWGALNNEAVGALEAKDYERAIELLERCHAAVPDESVFTANLAQALIGLALHWRGEGPVCEECLELLERAAELAPGREDLARLVDKWRTEAEVQRGFWEESSLHFDLSYDGSRTEILHDSFRVLNHLEKIYEELRLAFAHDPVREGRPRIPVVLYAREEFDSVTGLGDWAGGAFDGTVRVPVREGVSLDDRGLQSVLKHEVVHAFVHATGGKSVPGWLNEGLAQWLEPDARPAIEHARKRLAGHELFALDRLEGSLSTWQDSEAVGLAYAQSLVFCDFIAFQYGERVLFRMVNGCRDGVRPADTFRKLLWLELDVVLEDFADDL